MPQKCPPRDTKPPVPTVYPLQGGKVDPNFENQKNFPEKNKQPQLRPEKYAESIDEIRS